MSFRPRAAAVQVGASARRKTRLEEVLLTGLDVHKSKAAIVRVDRKTESTEALGLVPLLVASQGVVIPWELAHEPGAPMPDPNESGLVDERGNRVFYQPNGVNLRPGEGAKADLLWYPKTWWDPSNSGDKGNALTAAQAAYGFTAVTTNGAWSAASLAPGSATPGATQDGNGNWEYQLYTEDNVDIDTRNNKITITADLIPKGDPANVRDEARALLNWDVTNRPDDKIKHERLWQFTSGKAVHDNGGAGYGMGTMTFTVTNPNKLPVGCWPSMWLLGRGAWPTGGEIDILEMMPIEAGRRQISSSTHFGHHPTEREFDKGEIGAYNFGDKIEMKVTRTKTRVTVHARDADARTWHMINDVDLTNFENKGDVSEFMGGPMDLVANVAVGGAGLAMDLPGGMGRVSADPFYFRWAWTHAKWEIENIGWIPEEEYDSVTVPDPSRPQPMLQGDMKWAEFEPGFLAWERMHGGRG